MSIIYGADYNPEQWSKKTWSEDMRLMKEAGVTMVNLNIFGWALLEPSEGKYNFKMLDDLMDLLHLNQIDVDLATATAAQPAWLSKKYSDVLPKDQQMNTIWYGSRQSYCPNSPNYIRRATLLVKKIAQRYKNHPALKMWHINNEFSDHVHICYCDQCAVSFRKWLKEKYTLKTVNERWGTNFWSQKYYRFTEIIPPRQTSGDPNPGLVLDYKRFMSDSIMNLCHMEYQILKSVTPEVPITTNFMGNYQKPLDYFKWAKEIDIISWDSYPDIRLHEAYVLNAFTHDLMRSLKKQPHIMMEQAPNQVNWRDVNPNKKPNQMSAYSYQCLAHGGIGIMFFQWRQSLKGAEKFHSGMLPHAGEHSRVFKEVKELGASLKSLKYNPTKRNAKVAFLMDYDNWWALEYQPGPSVKMQYMDIMLEYYQYFYHENISIDFCSEYDDISNYDYVIAPNAYMVKEGTLDKIDAFVSCGGQFICGPFSGIVDESDTVFKTGYPGPFKEILGIHVEEYDATHENNFVSWFGQKLPCRDWCEVIHLNSAKSLGAYQEDYYKDGPAITENSYGLGKSYYISSRFDSDAITSILKKIVKLSNETTPFGVELMHVDDITFLINHTGQTQHLELSMVDYFTKELQENIILEPFKTFIGRDYETK